MPTVPTHYLTWLGAMYGVSLACATGDRAGAHAPESSCLTGRDLARARLCR